MLPQPALQSAAAPAPPPFAPPGVPQKAPGLLLVTFSSLRHANYRLLWAGTCFMSAGQWIQQVTLGWLLYDMTGSAALLGVLGGLRALPFLLVSPTAGVVADRMDRRMLMLRVESILVITAVAMGVLVSARWVEVWHVFAFTIVTGVAWSFNQPARMALVPNVVPRADLMNAIALNSLGFNINKVLGPSLGGLLIVLFGAGGNFFVQAVAYGTVVALVYLMRVPPTPPQTRESSAFANLKEGLAYVWTTPSVLAIMLLALIPNTFALPYMALMPVFAKDVLEVGPQGLGLMLAAPGLGAVVATLFLASMAYRVERKGPLLLWALVLLGATLVWFARSTTLPMALLALVGVGGFHILFAAASNTMIQTIVPDALRGRVMSIYMLDHGVAPAGTLLAGVSTQLLGGPFTVTAMGAAVILLASVAAWRAPQIRELRT